MSEKLTALASENLNPSLRSLLEDVQCGHIRVPRFQRPFVWKDDQRIQLLESIRDNMPIGSLLVWNTAQFDLNSFPTIGPHVIPALAGASIRGRQYLLDGHQRVSTLLGVLLQPSAPAELAQIEDEDSIDWDIQYDLFDQEFVFIKKLRQEKRPLLPLWTLLDGRLVNKHMRTMREQAKVNQWAEPDFESWEIRADQLSYRFQQCRIPIVVMVTDDLNLAARAFQRINSQGTPMGEAHLIAALTWTTEFDLREKLAERREDLPLGWRELEDRIFLQVCKGLIASDISKVNEDQLVKAIKNNSDLLDQATEGIRQAITLLSNKGGVVRQELLPYALQLVYLAIEFAKHTGGTIPAIPEQAFMTWFWQTAWTEAFGGASFRQVRAAQDALHKLRICMDRENWRGEPNPPRHFDPRHARSRLWMLRMAARSGLVDENGKDINTRMLLETHGCNAFVRLFPTPKGASPKLKQLLKSCGNRFLLEPNNAFTFRQWLLDPSKEYANFLKTHFIDERTLLALRENKLETFIEIRCEKIARWDLAEWNSEKQITGTTGKQGTVG